MEVKKLKECCTIIAGQSPESKYYNSNGDGLPFFQGKADFGVLYPSIRVYCSQPTKIAEKDDILLSVRAPVGPTNLAPCKVCIGRGLTAIRPSEVLLTRYVLLFFRYFEAQLASKGTGTTFKAITQDVVKNLEIPIPPLPEQQRIVARIEELFSQLDTGVETLKKTKAQLAVYRQAVLKEAFGSVYGTECKIDDVCKEIKVGIVIKPTQYYVSSDGVFAFRNANVRRGYIDDCDWVMISKEGHEKNRKSEVHTGDVLISRSGANLGMASPVSKRFDGYNAIDVVIAVPNTEKIIPAYLAHYTNSPMGRSIVKKNERGAAQGHLNVSAYGRLPIAVPSLDYQQAIVEIIDGKMSVCDSIEQTVDLALQQAEAMRQSILKDAFEGRL